MFEEELEPCPVSYRGLFFLMLGNLSHESTFLENVTKLYFFSGRKGYPCFKLEKNGCAPKSKGRKHPELEEETMRFLRKHFRPMVRTFEQQTGMKLELN